MEIRYNSDTGFSIIFADPRIKGDTNEKIKEDMLSAYSRPAFWRNMGDDGCGKRHMAFRAFHRFRVRYCDGSEYRDRPLWEKGTSEMLSGKHYKDSDHSAGSGKQLAG